MTEPDPGTDPFLSPPLDAEQLALLSRYGQERPTTAGQVLFREGDRGYDFIVVLSGAVSVIDHEAGVVSEPGSVLVVPVDRLHELITQNQDLSDVIVQVILRRRQWFVQQRAGLRIIGSRTSPDARRLREFAARNRLPHVWVDV